MKQTAALRNITAGIAIPLACAALWFAAGATGWTAAGSASFMPHGYCFLWNPRILWLNVISDGLITLSYYAIPLILVYFIRRHRDLPFNRIFWMFGAFILACGTTHLLEIWNVWHGSYLLAGGVKAVTAAVSVLTAIMLVPLVPRVMSLPRLVELQDANRKLEKEIEQRKRFDAPIEEPIQRWATLGFAVAVVLTLLAGAASWRRARNAEQDAAWVTHTLLVMNTIEATSNDVIRLQDGARAFALTGQEGFLQHSQTLTDNIGRDQQELRQLTADNASQQRRLDALDPQLRSAIAFYAAVVARRRRLPVYADNGDAFENQRLTDAVGAALQAMQAEEARLLGERSQREKNGQLLTRITTLLGVLLAIVLWVLARSAVSREVKISARARTQLRALNAELENRVAQRTSALEQSLATSEKAIKELADQKFALDQHAIVATTDVRGTITYANDKFCAISQYPREELLGKNHRLINSHHHPREFFEQMYRVIARGQVWRGDICNRAKDNSLYWVATTIVPFLDDAGKPRQYMAIRADITERMRLDEGHRLLASVVESSDDAIISKTLDGRITAWNRGAEKLFGYTASEVLGKPMLILFPANSVVEEATILERIGRGESMEHYEAVRVRKDGQSIDVSVTISPIRDTSGAVTGVSKITRDITQRKLAELELHQHQEELARSNRDLEQFAYAASHDLQEPLRAVSGCMHLLQARYQDKIDERANEFIFHAVDGAARMQKLIADLLAFSRVGTRGGELQPVACEKALEGALKNLFGAIQESQAIIEYDSLPTVSGDLGQLTLLFQNLIGNAIKFHGGETPRIHVDARRQGAEWVISVRDNGIGISPEYFERIFVIFQRLHTRKDYPGTGMGLALCKKIVERHGGQIGVESEPGLGTTFHFSLRVPPPARAATQVKTPEEAGSLHPR